ncbi:MAG: WD40/YVTN/BNR-like repeat-containing protein [Bacteroidales bacterium]
MKKHIFYLILITAVLFHGFALGQTVDEPEYKEMWKNLSPGVTLAEISEKAEAYFADRDQGRGSGYKQWKRWEYKMQNRLLPDGTIPNVEAMNLSAYNELVSSGMQTAGDDPESAFGYWSFSGPTSYILGAGWNGGIGRVNCIAFHPTNANIIYIGLPAGGMWRTTNGGTSWTCLTDGMPSIGVSGIAVHHTNPYIIYILTGDGDASDTQSIGVLKTTDGGVTWYPTGLSWNVTDFNRGFKLRMHPDNPNILFAATTTGIFKTTNGGTTWTNPITSGTIWDIQFKPGDPTIMYATRRYLTNAGQFWRSTNSGDTWTQVTSGVPTNASRMEIGVTPANVSRVYLLAGPATTVGNFVGVFLSTNSGTSFSTQSTSPNLLGYDENGNDNAHQTTFDLAIAVSRTNSAHVMTGGINIWTSTNSGVNWTIRSHWFEKDNTIGYTHADIHFLAINPLNNYLYAASDGGIFRTTNFGQSWTDLTTGIGATMWYRIAGTQSNTDLIIGGTQDNGSNKWIGGTAMLHMRGADGMDCMIDHSNSNILYTSRQNGGLEKSTNGGSSFTTLKPAGSTGSWVTPYVMNPGNSSIIYAGYNNGIYKSTNGGSSWTNTGGDGRSAMAHGVNNTSRVYAAAGTTFRMTNNAASSWTVYTAPGSVTGIAVNPAYSNVVFITVEGYTAGQKVYRSTDAGANWTNISGNLPNVPVNCIVYQVGTNDGIYIGTDIGVFYRNSDLGKWVPFMNGLPTVPVFDLYIYPNNNLIRAGTYGRGLWSSDLWSACPFSYNLTQGNDPSNPSYTGYQLYEATNSVTSSRIITGGIGTDVTYRSGGSVTLTTGFHAKAGNKFQAVLGPCYTGMVDSAITNEETEFMEEVQDE